MARGESGRIVIEVDPEIKNDLYQKLKCDESNLKSWFLEQVEAYLGSSDQLPLQFDSDLTPICKNDKP